MASKKGPREARIRCGGFEANREWRARYLGPGWDMAKVRGTRYNTGDGIRMALDIGAQAYGQWSGCHSVSWERYAPDFGELDRPITASRNGYPFSIMVNAEQKLGDGGRTSGLHYRNTPRVLSSGSCVARFRFRSSTGSTTRTLQGTTRSGEYARRASPRWKLHQGRFPKVSD